MKRSVLVPLVCVLAVMLAASATTTLAQERTIELTAGASFALLPRELEISDDLSWNLQLSYIASPRLSIGLVYEKLETEDTLKQQDPLTDVLVRGDATMELYGLSGVFAVSGDPSFELIALVSAGVGSLDYENPLGSTGSLANNTDLDLWYEAGVGARFALGTRSNIRLQMSWRRLHPDESSILIHKKHSAFVSSLLYSVRF
jgi:hypothetical protein